jgi:hypothetical protein
VRTRLKVPRTRSGRPSRAKAALASASYYRDETEREATSTAYRARQRLFRVSPDDASDPLLGTLIGRMRLAGREAEAKKRKLVDGGLTAVQYDAAIYWQSARSAMLRAIAAPGQPVEPRDGSGGIGDPANHEAAVRAAQAKYEAMRDWVGDRDQWQALDLFVVHEQYWPGRVWMLVRALDAVDGFMRDARRKR